ncbi:putative leucine rich repeat C-terminal domain protein [Trypoxylus dichotomus]
MAKSCPDMCVCKWKNGKQTVECSSRNFQAIPEGMDPNTQVLEFSTNKLQTLHSQMFLKMDLINLQRIYLSQNRITTIDEYAFKGLTNLVELDLSGNLLDTVPTAAFADCPSLMRLTLSYNPISILKRGSFTYLSFLHSLELSNCNVNHIEEGAFQGLHSIEWLHLDGNKLTTIKGNKVLPESLRGIELQGNLWRCDCNMLDLYVWLMNLNVPYSAEPTCKGPRKLAGRAIKSIPESELACLPNASPTALYLEIGEGKNISLLCHVHAVPEAHVSWWFQGQVLQNDTFVAPGMRLMYYVEEGGEEKRSELFIYNASADDNGTFICSAENAAGMAQSNFTVRIILKEEPLVIIVSFPFEYILAAVIGAGILVLIILIIVIVSIVRCRAKGSQKQKSEKTKEVASQYQQQQLQQQQQSTVKCMATTKENIEANRHEEALQTTRSCYDLLRTISPVTIPNQVQSPASLRRYHLEQNPDLINDAETVGRRRVDGDGEVMPPERDGQNERTEPLMHQSMVQFPITCMRNGRKLYNIHSWEGCPILDVEGYPVDYGLPKIHTAAIPAPNFYRTLPYNRTTKRQSAAVPISRYSREAEFLSRNAYEHYYPDVRYTADGYPVRPSDVAVTAETLPSPPEGYKSEANPAPSSLPCCSAVQWPQRMPSNVHLINSNLECGHQSKFANIGKRCVSAQTETEAEEVPISATTKTNPSTNTATHLTLNKTESTLNERNDPLNEVLTESPDEGYEGEPSVV